MCSQLEFIVLKANVAVCMQIKIVRFRLKTPNGYQLKLINKYRFL